MYLSKLLKNLYSEIIFFRIFVTVQNYNIYIVTQKHENSIWFSSIFHVIFVGSVCFNYLI